MGLREYYEKRKITIAAVLIVLNLALGLVSKLPILELIANPSSFYTNPTFYIAAIITYTFSWVIFGVGVFVLGKETWYAVRRKMRKDVEKSYHRHVGRHVKRHMRRIVDSFGRVKEKGRKKLDAAGTKNRGRGLPP